MSATMNANIAENDYGYIYCIRHNIQGRSLWVGVYNKLINRIISNGEQYSTLNNFTTNHYKTDRPDRTKENNAWAECYCEINSEWISTYNLPDVGRY